MAIQANYKGQYCPLCSRPIKEGQWIDKKLAFNIRKNRYEDMWAHSDCDPIARTAEESFWLGLAAMPEHIDLVRYQRPIYLERRRDGSKRHKRMVRVYYNHKTQAQLVIDSSMKIYDWTPDHNGEIETGWYEVNNPTQTLADFIGDT